MNPRKTLVIVVALGVGALHFIIGPDYDGPFRKFVTGYLIDILLPFTVYFLIALPHKIRSKWMIALLVCFIGFVVESLQYFGFPVLGRTFDPWDLFIYATGALLAMGVDIAYFSKLKPS